MGTRMAHALCVADEEPGDVIVERTRAWYEMFREIGRLPPELQAGLYLRITPSGRTALNKTL